MQRSPRRTVRSQNDFFPREIVSGILPLIPSVKAPLSLFWPLSSPFPSLSLAAGSLQIART